MGFIGNLLGRRTPPPQPQSTTTTGGPAEVVSAPPPAAPPAEPELSVRKLEDEFMRRLNAATTTNDVESAGYAVQALRLMEQYDTGKVTRTQITAYSTRMGELSTFIQNRNRDVGSPTRENLEQALSLAQTSLGAATLAQFVIASAQYGELSRYQVDVQPGATQQLGPAFGGNS